MAEVKTRLLPDFIIIGAMKCGTTTLYRLLLQHPEIGMSRDKETDFFVEEMNFRRGLDWYSGQFKPGRKLYGEASPNYTKCDDFRGVPQRIRATCPDARLIYVVRDPIVRFQSQYRHSLAMGDISMSPAELTATDEYRHILSVSRYAHQTQAFLDQFPREQLLFVDFDAMVTDQNDPLNPMLDFIGASPFVPQTGTSFNDSAKVSKIPTSIRRLAQSRFGRSLSQVMSREARDRVADLMAWGKPKPPQPFPPALLERIRGDLREDAAQFRTLSGLPLDHWSV